MFLVNGKMGSGWQNFKSVRRNSRIRDACIPGPGLPCAGYGGRGKRCNYQDTQSKYTDSETVGRFHPPGARRPHHATLHAPAGGGINQIQRGSQGLDKYHLAVILVKHVAYEA